MVSSIFQSWALAISVVTTEQCFTANKLLFVAQIRYDTQGIYYICLSFNVSKGQSPRTLSRCRVVLIALIRFHRVPSSEFHERRNKVSLQRRGNTKTL